MFDKFDVNTTSLTRFGYGIPNTIDALNVDEADKNALNKMFNKNNINDYTKDELLIIYKYLPYILKPKITQHVNLRERPYPHTGQSCFYNMPLALLSSLPKFVEEIEIMSKFPHPTYNDFSEVNLYDIWSIFKLSYGTDNRVSDVEKEFGIKNICETLKPTIAIIYLAKYWTSQYKFICETFNIGKKEIESTFQLLLDQILKYAYSVKLSDKDGKNKELCDRWLSLCDNEEYLEKITVSDVEKIIDIIDKMRCDVYKLDETNAAAQYIVNFPFYNYNYNDKLIIWYMEEKKEFDNIKTSYEKYKSIISLFLSIYIDLNKVISYDFKDSLNKLKEKGAKIIAEYNKHTCTIQKFYEVLTDKLTNNYRKHIELADINNFGIYINEGGHSYETISVLLEWAKSYGLSDKTFIYASSAFSQDLGFIIDSLLISTDNIFKIFVDKPKHIVSHLPLYYLLFFAMPFRDENIFRDDDENVIINNKFKYKLIAFSGSRGHAVVNIIDNDGTIWLYDDLCENKEKKLCHLFQTRKNDLDIDINEIKLKADDPETIEITKSLMEKEYTDRGEYVTAYVYVRLDYDSITGEFR